MTYMDMFYALAEPNRRSILEMLSNQGGLSVSAIAGKFKISTAAVSQHLKILREAKLINVEKRAQQRIYRLNPDALAELEKWAQQMSANFDNLEIVLKRKD